MKEKALQTLGSEEKNGEDMFWAVEQKFPCAHGEGDGRDFHPVAHGGPLASAVMVQARPTVHCL